MKKMELDATIVGTETIRYQDGSPAGWLTCWERAAVPALSQTLTKEDSCTDESENDGRMKTVFTLFHSWLSKQWHGNKSQDMKDYPLTVIVGKTLRL